MPANLPKPSNTAKQEIPDGGPAFPCPAEAFPYSGMTLRDYFAAHATWTDIDLVVRTADLRATGGVVQMRADARYRFADAMLKARAK